MDLEHKFKQCRAYKVKTPTTAATEAGAKELANAEIGAARFYAISLSRATILSGWAMDIGLLLAVLVALWVLA